MNMDDMKRVEGIRERNESANVIVGHDAREHCLETCDLLAIIDRQRVATREDVERLAGVVHDAMRQNDGLEVGEIRCAYVVARAALRAMGMSVEGE